MMIAINGIFSDQNSLFVMYKKAHLSIAAIVRDNSLGMAALQTHQCG
jgi:hypothetical protein